MGMTYNLGYVNKRLQYSFSYGIELIIQPLSLAYAWFVLECQNLLDTQRITDSLLCDCTLTTSRDGKGMFCL